MIRGKLIGDQARTIRHAPDSEDVQGRIRTLRAEPTSSAASQFQGCSSFYPLARPSGALIVVIETEGGYGRWGRVSDGRRPLEERIDDGAQWDALPQDDYPPKTTCHDRFQEWNDRHVFPTILAALSEMSEERKRLDLREAFIDGTFSAAKKGAPTSAPPRRARAPRS